MCCRSVRVTINTLNAFHSHLEFVCLVVGGLLLLQLLHDLGHYVAARLNEVEVAFPSVLIPSLQIGLFGSVTRFLSFPKTRRQLFDVSIAGPVTGFIASLACLLGGFYLTAGASPDALGKR